MAHRSSTKQRRSARARKLAVTIAKQSGGNVGIAYDLGYAYIDKGFETLKTMQRAFVLFHNAKTGA